MEKNFYFVLFMGSSVANTYIGSRSNAKAYFKRWVRKNVPYYEEYDFVVYRFIFLSEMLSHENPVDSYHLVL